MSDFLKDCFQKIGWEKDHVSFGDLPLFLKAMAYRFPFENRAVLAKENYKITKEELWRRLLKDQHGGLCYDLNGFLYFVLREAGFHVKLIRGTVYAGDQEGWALEGTHAAVWLSAENGDYLVDIGFGINTGAPADTAFRRNGTVTSRVIPNQKRRDRKGQPCSADGQGRRLANRVRLYS